MNENQENQGLKAEPTEGQLALIEAQKKEQNECWSAVTAVLEKYGYQFEPTLTINGRRGIGFIIDIIKKPEQAKA